MRSLTVVLLVLLFGLIAVMGESSTGVAPEMSSTHSDMSTASPAMSSTGEPKPESSTASPAMSSTGEPKPESSTASPAMSSGEPKPESSTAGPKPESSTAGPAPVASSTAAPAPASSTGSPAPVTSSTGSPAPAASSTGAAPAPPAAPSSLVFDAKTKVAGDPYFGKGFEDEFTINGVAAPMLTVVAGQSYNITAAFPYYHILGITTEGYPGAAGGGAQDPSKVVALVMSGSSYMFTPQAGVSAYYYFCNITTHTYMGNQFVVSSAPMPGASSSTGLSAATSTASVSVFGLFVAAAVALIAKKL